MIAESDTMGVATLPMARGFRFERWPRAAIHGERISVSECSSTHSLALPSSDTGAVQLRESQLPFFEQLRRLAVSIFGTGKHPFGMGALSIWRSAGHWS